MSYLHYCCLLFAALFSIRLINLLNKRKRNPGGLPYPPGPKPLPIIGNFLDMPRASEWLTVTSWKMVYGDLVHVEILGMHIVFANTMDICRDLFEKRSSKYSSRPKLTMVNDVIGWQWITPLMPYGPEWKKHRKTFHQFFQPSVSPSYHPGETLQARKLLSRLLSTPEDFNRHIEHLAVAVILRSVYGIDVRDGNDKFVKIAQEGSDALMGAVIPGRFLVDMLPFLKYVPAWMPGAHFKRIAKEWRKCADRLRTEPFEYSKNRIERGESPICTVSIMLDTIKETKQIPSEEENMKSVAATAYIGAYESITSTLLHFLLAMLLNPKVQTIAQAQLDSALGGNRLPEFQDRERLPYIEAIMMETMRWHPIAGLGLAHSVSEDDEYNGYFIPKGSIVMGNVWALFHDEKVYSDPFSFDPGRFLDAEGRLDPSVPHPSLASFGFGRRMCPGRHMASDILFITIASILSAFDIRNALDKFGNPVQVTEELTTGVVSFPKPFKCHITPRKDAVPELISQSLA